MSVNIATNDPNVKSSVDWRYDGTGGYIETTKIGGSVKLGFSGTSLAVFTDPGPLSGVNYAPLFDVSIDGGAVNAFSVPLGAAGPVSVASGLGAGNHTALIRVRYLQLDVDQWVTPHALRIAAFQVDNGSASVDAATIDGNFYDTGHILVYGTSIEVGWNNLANAPGQGQMDGTLAWGSVLARSLGMQFGPAGVSSQGMTQGGAGGTPPLFTPGNAANTAWDKYDQAHSRLGSDGKYLVQPSKIILGGAYNDRGQIPTFQTRLALLLPLLRAAAPIAPVYVFAPFCDLGMSVTIRGATQAAVAASGVSNVYYVDLGQLAGVGLVDTVTTLHETVNSWDSVHPKSSFDAVLATMAANAITTLSTSGNSNGNSNAAAIAAYAALTSGPQQTITTRFAFGTGNPFEVAYQGIQWPVYAGTSSVPQPIAAALIAQGLAS